MNAAAKKPATKSKAKRPKVRAAKSPAVIWALLARELVKDKKGRTVSAINIVEDFDLPEEIFAKTDSEEPQVVDIGGPLTLAFTIDWRWPEPVEADSTQIQIDWYTPSGRGFSAAGGNMGDPIKKPASILRTHIEVRIQDLPICEQGIYHFDILLNGKSAAKVPVRIRAENRSVSAAPKNRSKAKKRMTKRP
jgi:hypothetical protein